MDCSHQVLDPLSHRATPARIGLRSEDTVPGRRGGEGEGEGEEGEGEEGEGEEGKGKEGDGGRGKGRRGKGRRGKGKREEAGNGYNYVEQVHYNYST